MKKTMIASTAMNAASMQTWPKAKASEPIQPASVAPACGVCDGCPFCGACWAVAFRTAPVQGCEAAGSVPIIESALPFSISCWQRLESRHSLVSRPLVQALQFPHAQSAWQAALVLLAGVSLAAGLRAVAFASGAGG